MQVKMNKYLVGNGWEKSGECVFNRVSRWIKIRQIDTITERSQLWDYVTDGYGYTPWQQGFDPDENGLYCDYFIFRGRKYAVNRFWALGSIAAGVMYSYDTPDGKTHFLSGVDNECPISGKALYLEIDDCNEYVRMYEG